MNQSAWNFLYEFQASGVRRRLYGRGAAALFAIPVKTTALISSGTGVWLIAIVTDHGNSPPARFGLLTLNVGLVILLDILMFRVLGLIFRVLGLIFRVLGLIFRLVLAQEWPAKHGRRLPHRLARLSASSLISLAVLLAGRRRSALGDEWRAHLAGESGHDPVTWPKVSQALGFIASAVQCRLADVADIAWRPVDAVLESRFLSNLSVWGPVIAVLVAIVHHDGRFGLVADDQDPVALGAFLYGAIRTGRWWRGVKPPEPQARRVRE